MAIVTINNTLIENPITITIIPVTVYVNKNNEITYECRGLFYGVGIDEPNLIIAEAIAHDHTIYSPFDEQQIANGCIKWDVKLTSFSFSKVVYHV